jgi:hypothetical protein
MLWIGSKAAEVGGFIFYSVPDGFDPSGLAKKSRATDERGFVQRGHRATDLGGRKRQLCTDILNVGSGGLDK